MLLRARPLLDVQGVNSFRYGTAWRWQAGNPIRLYFQLTDESVDRPECGASPAGRRYCPPAGTTMTAQLQQIDDARTVSRAGVQAFPTLDASIWYLDVMAQDLLVGTADLVLTLVEPTRTLRARVKAAGLIEQVDLP